MSERHEGEIGLTYPFAEHPAGPRPKDGVALEVRPGVFWLRMPIPIPGLNFINLWLLRDNDGWTLVDTGLLSTEIKQIWEGIFDRYLDGRPITRLICTHFHPDHLGLAGWLQQRWNAPLWMTLGEWSFGRMLALEALPDVPDSDIQFYRRCGFDDAAVAELQARGFGNFSRNVSPIPRSYTRIVEGDHIRINDADWRVIVGRGHSPEHACLYSPSLNLLISGDQVLPRISPHIGVYPSEPDSRSLTLYLRSLDKFADLPADVLVLPAHGDAFVGLHARIAYLKRHHRERLDALMLALEKPHTVMETLPLLFRRDISGHLQLATGEALAHLHHLMAEGLIERRLNAAGVHEYQRADIAMAAQ